jgi:ABC-type amino acid transport system permease subunit
MGLSGGTGGALCSCPFLRDAPAGRLIVSITEVVERKTGSEISDFAIDFFRNTPCLFIGCTMLGLKAAALGVVGLETGGVWLEENSGIGEVGFGLL